MTQARRSLIPEGSSGYYHCVNRCVRRSWLCGLDAISGRSFDHRRGWIEKRLMALSAVVAVSICAYAVMNNHLHAVMKVDAIAGAAWSDREVAERWCQLFPCREDQEQARIVLRIQQIEADAVRLEQYRSRLMRPNSRTTELADTHKFAANSRTPINSYRGQVRVHPEGP